MASVNPNFSPRILVESTALGLDELFANEAIWMCSTCSLCTSRCPNEVQFPEFISDVRKEAIKQGIPMAQSHKNIFEIMSKMMVQKGRKPDLLATWDTKGLQTSEKGEVFFFAGCLPHLNAMFSPDIGVNLLRIAEDSIRILNSMNIKPVLSSQQVCCGHDSLWGGDDETFEKLAQKNAQLISESGASTVITSCAECYRTLKKDYPIDAEVFHISQFVANNEVEFKNEIQKTVAFHDPCRLGRQMGEYAAPRKILNNIPGLKLVEISRSRKDSQCCGVGAWIPCNKYSKLLMVDKIEDVVKTGATTLALACPKCQIHLKCLLSEKGEEKAVDANIDIRDITSLVWEAIAGKED